MDKTYRSHFTEKSQEPLFNCCIIIPCTSEEFHSNPLHIYIASDQSFLHKPFRLWFGVTSRKRVASFVYSTLHNPLEILYGPRTVPFADIVTGEEYGKVDMYIEYVERFATFCRFPSLKGLSSHVCCLSIVIKSADLYVQVCVEYDSVEGGGLHEEWCVLRALCEQQVCRLHAGVAESLSVKMRSALRLGWNFRFLLSADYYNPKNTFYLALHYNKNCYIGEVKQSCEDLFSDRVDVQELAVRMGVRDEG